MEPLEGNVLGPGELPTQAPERGAAGVVVSVVGDGVSYRRVVSALNTAEVRLSHLADMVGATYRYVADCAGEVDRIAGLMEQLSVDADTIAEHRDASASMRAVLEVAEQLASEMTDLAAMFRDASDTHQAEYGSVHEAATNLPQPMADGLFYSNR